MLFRSRYSLAPLAAQKPGLPVREYILWADSWENLSCISDSVGTAPHFFGYILSCGGEFDEQMLADMKARPTLLLDKAEGNAGMTIRKLSSVPPIEAKDPLYFLADMSFALEETPGYDLTRAFPILAETHLRHLGNPPLLLPLDVNRDDDAALIRWYLSGGAVKGRLMLFSAKGSALDVARHLGYIHIIWWPKSEKEKKKEGTTEPDMAFIHPGNGPFMKAVLPNIGENAARTFLGPVSGIWYMVQEVEGDQWYEAKPDPALFAPLPGPRMNPEAKKPVILLSETVDDALSEEMNYHMNVSLSHRFLKEYPDTSSSPLSLQEAFTYVSSIRDEVSDYGMDKRLDRNRAAELFWRFRHDEKATESLRAVFSDTNIPVSNRLEEARRTVGLPAEVR